MTQTQTQAQTLVPVYLNTVGVVCCQGLGMEALQQGLRQPAPLPALSDYGTRPLPLGRYDGPLPSIDLPETHWHSRNNQMAHAAYSQIQADVAQAIQTYGAARVGVVIGTSTSGIAETEQALEYRAQNGKLPDSFAYPAQEMGATAAYIATVSGCLGPTYGISTACSSGAKALASARGLIRAGVCDAVISGGVDTLCKLTVQGFSALEAVSDSPCNPFSRNRKGINIGEAGALFLVTKEPKGAELKGVGSSSDAHHISAPDPAAGGAIASMQEALDDAGITAAALDYVNLHGTATTLNDQMEATAMAAVCGPETPCSSTKPVTGHTLGAAGALEAAICWQLLQNPQRLPCQYWDKIPDPALPILNLVKENTPPPKSIDYTLSNSFAFGGNNIALLLGKITSTQ